MAGSAIATGIMSTPNEALADITFKDGKTISLNDVTIKNVYRSAPTPSYADGEVVLLDVSSKYEGEEFISKPKAPFVSSLFYYNTQTGDPNAYQIEGTLTEGNDGNMMLEGKPNIPLIKVPSGVKDWTKRLKNNENKLVLLPDEAQSLTYAFQTAQGDLLVVTNRTFNNHGDKKSHSVYLGKPGQMQRFDVDDFMRFRDGGTTNISYKDSNGTTHKLHSPTPFKRDIPCTLDEKDIRDVKSDYSERPQQRTLGIRGLAEPLNLKSPN